MAVLDPPPQQPPSKSYTIQMFCPVDKQWVSLTTGNHPSIRYNTYYSAVEAETIMHKLQQTWGPALLRVIDNNGSIFCQTKKSLFENP